MGDCSAHSIRAAPRALLHASHHQQWSLGLGGGAKRGTAHEGQETHPAAGVLRVKCLLGLLI